MPIGYCAAERHDARTLVSSAPDARAAAPIPERARNSRRESDVREDIVYLNELRYSTTSRSSRLVRRAPIGGIADGPFARLTMSDFRIRFGVPVSTTMYVAVSSLSVPNVFFPSLSVTITGPNPGAMRALGSMSDSRICGRVSRLATPRSDGPTFAPGPVPKL